MQARRYRRADHGARARRVPRNIERCETRRRRVRHWLGHEIGVADRHWQARHVWPLLSLMASEVKS